MNYITLCQKLVERGALTESQDRKGCTPLMLAVQRSHHACVKALIGSLLWLDAIPVSNVLFEGLGASVDAQDAKKVLRALCLL